MSMTYTDASNNRCCTCQYWKGERRYDARMKRVHYENFASDLEPCSMKFKRPGATSSTGCRGFKRWVELYLLTMKIGEKNEKIASVFTC